jgi:hypothetical protein
MSLPFHFVYIDQFELEGRQWVKKMVVGTG